MVEFSKLAVATLLQVEERCGSLGWGFILAFDDGQAEALVYEAGAEIPTFTGRGNSTCEALEKLAEDIVDADLKYSERKVKDDSKTEETDSTDKEPSREGVHDEDNLG